MNGNIFNSKGVHVGVVTEGAIFGLQGQKLALRSQGFEHLQVEWRPSWSFTGCARREEAFGQSGRQAVPGRLGTFCRCDDFQPLTSGFVPMQTIRASATE